MGTLRVEELPGKRDPDPNPFPFDVQCNKSFSDPPSTEVVRPEILKVLRELAVRVEKIDS